MRLGEGDSGNSRRYKKNTGLREAVAQGLENKDPLTVISKRTGKSVQRIHQIANEIYPERKELRGNAKLEQQAKAAGMTLRDYLIMIGEKKRPYAAQKDLNVSHDVIGEANRKQGFQSVAPYQVSELEKERRADHFRKLGKNRRKIPEEDLTTIQQRVTSGEATPQQIREEYKTQGIHLGRTTIQMMLKRKSKDTRSQKKT